MKLRMRFPWATLALCFVFLGVYFYSSEGALYPNDSMLNQAAFGFPNLGGILFHLFFHVGLLHLFGNLIPFIVFALVIEESLSHQDVFYVFLVSGLVAGFIFSLLNPSTLLVGASAGISGLMAAGTVVNPKKGIPLLLLLPLAVSFIVSPSVTAFSQAAVDSLASQKQSLEDTAAVFEAQNKTVEAQETKEQVKVVEQKIALTVQGQERERKTPTDLVVHAVGAVVGFFFVSLIRKKKFEDGMDEMVEIVEWAREKTHKMAKSKKK